MGRDINSFIECDLSKEYGHAEKPFTGIVSCFAEVYLDRNYDLFGALGLIGDSGSPVSGELAVYNEIVKRETPRPPLFPARGIPHPMSAMARGSIEMWVVDEDKEEKLFDAKSLFLTDRRDGTTIRKKDAERLIESGKSKYLLDDEGNECKFFITNPDYMCPSWLLLNELKKALAVAGFSSQITGMVPDKDGMIHVLPWDYELLILTMEGIEKRIGSGRTRLVYWFDE
jgi:hypothetical protein